MRRLAFILIIQIFLALVIVPISPRKNGIARASPYLDATYIPSGSNVALNITDAENDERTDLGLSTNWDILWVKIWADYSTIGVEIHFKDINITSGENVVMVQLAFDTSLDGNGQQWFARYADTKIAKGMEWNYLIATNFHNGSTPSIFTPDWHEWQEPGGLGSVISGTNDVVSITVGRALVGLHNGTLQHFRLAIGIFCSDASGNTKDIGGSTVSNMLDAITPKGPNTWDEVSDGELDYAIDLWVDSNGLVDHPSAFFFTPAKNGIYAKWLVTGKSNHTFEYGYSPDSLSTTAPESCVLTPLGYLYSVYIENPTGSELYYRVITATHNFTTLRHVKLPHNESISFIAFGDTRDSPESPHNFTVLANIVQKTISADPDVILFTGDAVLDSTDFASWMLWLDTMRPVFESYLVVMSRGNHDVSSYGFFESLVGPPHLAKVGPLTIVVMDSENQTEAQSNWLNTVMTSSEIDTPWVIGLIHRPFYAVGETHDNFSWGIDNLLKPLCGKVSVVFAGHEHLYARTKPLCDNSVIEVVTGGGGAPLYNPLNESYIEKTAKVYHYIRGIVNDTTFYYTAIALNGTVIDSLSLSNSSLPSQIETLPQMWLYVAIGGIIAVIVIVTIIMRKRRSTPDFFEE